MVGTWVRMSGKRLTKKVCESHVEGRRVRGRHFLICLDGIKKACNAKYLDLKAKTWKLWIEKSRKN